MLAAPPSSPRPFALGRQLKLPVSHPVTCAAALGHRPARARPTKLASPLGARLRPPAATPGGSGAPDDADDPPTTSSSSSDDDPPLTIPAVGSWRDVRAALIAGEAAAAGEAPGPDGDVWSARFTPENVHLLQTQDRALAREALWAHATGSPEPGGLLIASPDAPDLLGDDRAWQLVVLVTAHDPRTGSAGLILNRPAAAVLGDLLGWGLNLGGGGGLMEAEGRGGGGAAARPPPPSSTDLGALLGPAPVYLGGYFPPARIARQPVTLLHGTPDLQGAVELAPGAGLFTGGAAAVGAAVASGDLPLTGLRVFAGALTWPPGALGAEVDAGAWIPAAASRALALKPCLGLPVPLWVEALTLMGGEWAGVARRGRGPQR